MKQEPHRISALEAKCRLAEQAFEMIRKECVSIGKLLPPLMGKNSKDAQLMIHTKLVNQIAWDGLTALTKNKP